MQKASQLVNLSEEQIVTRLRDERWLKSEFKLKRLESYQNVYHSNNDSREADLVGIDYSNNVYAFEVKKEKRDIGTGFDQVSAYCQGADFVYCVLEEKSVSRPSMEMLRKTGIGLILYRLEKGNLTEIRREIESRNHIGRFAKRTKDSMTEKVATPECFVFPTSKDRGYEYLRSLWKNSARASEDKLADWYYDGTVLPPSGSIIIFSSGGAFVGQGIAIESRSTTADDRRKGCRWKRLLILWRKSILKYPRKVPIAEVKDGIGIIRNRDLKRANLVLKYRAISLSEGQKIVSKALNVLSSNKRPDNSD